MGIIYNFLSGKLKADRAYNRQMFELYEGGRRSRARSSAPATWHNPEDSKVTQERLQLILEARSLEDNFPLAGLVLDTYETYALGDVRYQPMTGDVELNREIMDWLKVWYASCDVTGRFSFQSLCRLALRSYLRDGECGFIHLHRGDRYELQAVSGDRIGDPTAVKIPSRNNFNGIIVDDEGKVQSYQIYSRLPDEWLYEFDREVPASYFSHVFSPFRFEQYHGVSVFKAVTAEMKDLKEVMDDSRINIKYRSRQLPYYKTESGGFPQGPNPVRRDSPATPQRDRDGVDLVGVRGGEQQVLRINEGLFEFPNDFPNQQFLPWVQSTIRSIMGGVGLTYEFVYNSEKMTGTVGRLIVERTDRAMKIARDTMKERFMAVAIRRAIRHGKDIGAITGDSASLYEGEFFYGARISADYGRDANADIALVDAGLLTETEYQHIHGRDPDAVRSIRLAEKKALADDGKELAEHTGLPLNNAMNLIKQTYQVPPQMETVSATAMPDQVGGDGVDAPPPVKALIEEIGIGGSAALTAIVQSYGKGEMSRETAIEMIVTVFGMSRESAEKIMGNSQIVTNAET